jgi:hypothetical protein
MVRHSVPHSLETAAARHLLERAFTHYETRYPAYEPSLSWLEPQRAEVRFSARGIKLAAQVELLPGEVVVEMKVPLLLRPFQGAAIKAIDREVNRWLATPPQ